MKNPSSYIRQKLVALLNETITYNGFPVPCFDGEGEVTAYQILLMGGAKTTRRNRDAFIWNCEQRIEVISEQHQNTHKHVDAIADSVLNTLKPTPKTSGLTGNSAWQIINVEVEINNYIDELSGEGGYINRLPLTLNFSAIQIQ